MSAANDGERTDPTGDGRVDDAEGARTAADRQLGTILAAGRDLLDALRRLTTGLLALVTAEARILRASVAVVFLGSVALVAFAVSLWICLVALIGWALVMATHSVGIALALLVVLHLILVAVIWFAIKRAMRHASFPQSRAEFKALRRMLRDDVARFRQASPPDPSAKESPP